MSETGAMWRVFADTGGTFTDVLAVDPAGAVRRAKVLSIGAVRGVVREVEGSRVRVEGIAREFEAALVGMTIRFGGGKDGGEGENGSGGGNWERGDRGGRGEGAGGRSARTEGRIVAAAGGWIEWSEAGDEAGSVASGVEGRVAGVAVGMLCEIASGEEAPVFAARLLTGTSPGGGAVLPWMKLRIATTRGTNALLTRRGATGGVAFFVTSGFADLLEIGTQQRPRLFDLNIQRPGMLYREVFEVRERIGADGAVIEPIDLDHVRRAARGAIAKGMRSAAVALLHSDRFPAHERMVERVLREEGFGFVACSSVVSGMIRVTPRAQTAVVEAYIGPVIRGYVDGIAGAIGGRSDEADGGAKRGARASQWGGSTIHVLTSAGGLASPGTFRATDSLLSGPAGGVVGAGLAAAASGFTRSISFDMGGTSTDVARLEPWPALVHEHRVGEAHLVAPAVAIETVAAGGGSICACERGELRVGPESAGAMPGPACYGLGGPLTLTDVNVLLGRIAPERFAIPIDERASRSRAEELLMRVRAERGGSRVSGVGGARGTGDGLASEISMESMLGALLTLACERMCGAIRQVSTRAGYDPREYALVAFGGAGGQHACAVARRLGMRKVLVPRDAGLLSAAGLSGARAQRIAERQVLRRLEEMKGAIAGLVRETDAAALRALAVELGAVEVGAEESEGGSGDGERGERGAITRRIAALRMVGQESCVEVECGDVAGGAGEVGERREADAVWIEVLIERFRAGYRAVYGHTPSGGRAVELVWLKSVATAEGAGSGVLMGRDGIAGSGSGVGAAIVGVASGSHERKTRRAYFDGEWLDVVVRERDSLACGERVAGPALVVEAHGATVIEPGWSGAADATGALVLEWIGGGVSASAAGMANAAGSAGGAERGADESLVRLELFSARLQGLAQEMGEMLRRTAVSVNVKERLDFSCAVLDHEGELIVNAPHVPVHLGSLGLCVRRVRELIEMRRGDAVIVNHPGMGGSHLPDITVITPCFARGGAGEEGMLIGYAASRAHHAEIGGVLPGSMPPLATRLEEEGVVIAPMHLVRGGESCEDDVRRVLEGARYPSRNVEDNLADLRAAVAANQLAAESLERLAREMEGGNERGTGKGGAGGVEAVRGMMGAIKRRGREAAEELIARFEPGVYHAEERLDDGSVLRVRVTLGGKRAVFDFTGTAPTHAGNLNATPAIVRSVVVYVLRCLVAAEIPLNEGLMHACEIVLPTCMLSPAFTGDASRDPAVGAGNVETSQRLVDTVFKALRVVACSQGTMNNVIFGSTALGLSFYETVCGGTGAGPGFDGASGVHSHMTNTRITDPEILETRYPVRLRRFGIRRGSGGVGGAGGHRGGDGVVREIEFLAPMSLAVVSQHRVERPYGMNGGEAGLCGTQRVVLADGSERVMGPVEGIEVGRGDRLVMETPGGGGWGGR